MPEKDLENQVKRLLEEEENSKPDNINSWLKSLDFEIERKPHGEYAYFFDQSLERLKNLGYERHLMPYEILSLIINHLEGKLENNLNRSVTAMLKNGQRYGYWLSIAVSREEDSLICYTNPENLKKYDNYPYYRSENGALRFDKELRFNVKGIPSQKLSDLRLFNEGFVEFFYSRKFKDLPEAIQEGRVFLPPEDVLSPGMLYLPMNSMKQEFSLSFYEFDAFSRGVRVRR